MFGTGAEMDVKKPVEVFRVLLDDCGDINAASGFVLRIDCVLVILIKDCPNFWCPILNMSIHRGQTNM